MEGMKLEKIEELWQLIRQSRYSVALTGAGVSTLSGIPDFRSETGLWQKYDPYKIFDVRVYRSEPHHFWTFAFDHIYDFFEKQPNVVHRVLARLEEQGWLKGVITQNIDLLHQKAGSKVVIEVHGSPVRHYCLDCGIEMELEDVKKVVARREIPHCPACGGLIKPDITFFGEMLPERAIERAFELARMADLLLLLGSSMVVYPANLIPEEFLRTGGDLVIVNRQPTQYDSMATLRFSELAEVFSTLEEFMESN